MQALCSIIEEFRGLWGAVLRCGVQHDPQRDYICVSIYRLISMYNGSDSNTSAHTRFVKPLETRSAIIYRSSMHRATSSLHRPGHANEGLGTQIRAQTNSERTEPCACMPVDQTGRYGLETQDLQCDYISIVTSRTLRSNCSAG